MREYYSHYQRPGVDAHTMRVVCIADLAGVNALGLHATWVSYVYK